MLAITGPRQSGKTTLARALFADKPYVSLEDPVERAFAHEDPRGNWRQSGRQSGSDSNFHLGFEQPRTASLRLQQLGDAWIEGNELLAFKQFAIEGIGAAGKVAPFSGSARPASVLPQTCCAPFGALA